MCALASVDIDGLIVDKIWVNHTRNDLSIESDGLLAKLVRIATVAESNFFERVTFVLTCILVLPFFNSLKMMYERAGNANLISY